MRLSRLLRLRLGLRPRFFLYSNTVIAVTMTLVTLIAMEHERRSQQEAVVSRGRGIVEAMAVPVTQLLRAEVLGAATGGGLVDEHLAAVQARSQGSVRWAAVIDPTGRVVHASHPELLGRVLLHLASSSAVAAGAPSHEVVDRGRGDRVLEVRSRLAIPTDSWAVLVVAFSLEPVQGQVRRLARRAGLVALVLMLFNSILTALYVETLIRPILNLNRTMKWAGRGDLSVRAPFESADEVGELADAFNRMMDELEAARDREKVQRALLAHTEKMAAVGTLAAGVAHEVNNPLSGVLACIENLRDDPDDREMRERYLKLIEDGLKRIERTVTNLLNFARQRELRPEPTSLNHNLHHVVELIGYQLRKAGVEVRFDLDPQGALVRADHFQMEQLFLNLMLNAMQAMPEGGELRFRTRTRGGEVVAEVEDTGTGIPEEIRDRIFDPFFTTREVGEGTGLGLAVSDTIVRAHGGTLTVRSRLGKGTTFRIALPAMAKDGRDGEAA